MISIPKSLVESTFSSVVEKAKRVRRASTKLVMIGICPICNGGKHKEKKFYLYEKSGEFNVECKRGSCGYSKRFTNFLIEHFPEKYEIIKHQCFEDIKSGQIFKKQPEVELEYTKINPTNNIHIFLLNYFKKSCIKLTEPHGIEKLEKYRQFAINYLEKRGIHKEIWSNYLACFNGDYLWRIIIPFINKEGLYYNFQARDFHPEPDALRKDKKYIFAQFDNIQLPDDKIYKQYLVDPSKTVYICEGILDSEFIENSIALCGVSLGDKYQYIKSQYPKRIWCIDNPYVDKAGFLTITDLLTKGETCFVAPYEFNDCKDINDIAKKLNIPYLSEDFIIKNSIVGNFANVGKFKILIGGRHSQPVREAWLE